MLFFFLTVFILIFSFVSHICGRGLVSFVAFVFSGPPDWKCEATFNKKIKVVLFLFVCSFLETLQVCTVASISECNPESCTISFSTLSFSELESAKKEYCPNQHVFTNVWIYSNSVRKPCYCSTTVFYNCIEKYFTL